MTLFRSGLLRASVTGLALLDVLVLANPPQSADLLYNGGFSAALFGLAMLTLLPLVIFFQLSVGALFTRCFSADHTHIEPWLVWLSGTAIVSLLGVALAILGLINPYVCGTLFVGLIAFDAMRPHSYVALCIDRVRNWICLADASQTRHAFFFIRLGVFAAVVLIGLRAATGELNDSDVVQFYWAWLNEVRHTGSILLSPDLPLILKFANGRGDGGYLFFAGLAPGIVVHVISASYLILFSLILHQAVLKSIFTFEGEASPLVRLAADLALLAALWMGPGAIAFGKFHLQFAAWALGFALAALLIANPSTQSKTRYGLALMPLAVALPIALAQFEAFILLTIGIAFLIRPNWLTLRRLLPIAIVSAASAGLSLVANWLYLGIPDISPFQLFQHLIIDQRFDIWTSRLQQQYINYIQAGVLTAQEASDMGQILPLKTLIRDISHNWVALFMAIAAICAAGLFPWLVRKRETWQSWVVPLSGLASGFILYKAELAFSLTDLALKPTTNKLLLVVLATAIYLLVVAAGKQQKQSLRMALGLLGYWLACKAFVLLFHSGSLDRMMRHADIVGIALLLIAVVYTMGRWPRLLPVASMAATLICIVTSYSLLAARSAAAVDPPTHLIAATFGLEGRAAGLTNPLAKFARCLEIPKVVPAGSRAIFLNAYTASGFCNSGIQFPLQTIELIHESDYARAIESASFPDADQAERELHRLNINYFAVLKGDSEFWVSGLSAPFRPGELTRRFDLFADTPSFYILTWRGAGKPMPAEAESAITEWRRIAIQQHGFMWNNEFIGQWRAMANLGADRPKYALGTTLDFTSKGWSALYADHGWYAAEPTGTWTLGSRAVLTLPLTQKVSGGLAMDIEFMPFLVPQLMSRNVRMKVDGQLVAAWTFKLGDGLQKKTVAIPGSIAIGKQRLNINLEIDDARSPYALRISPDWRRVGIMVRNIVIREASAPN